eukprot:8568212-Karenia_brevis.AAC.1
MNWQARWCKGTLKLREHEGRLWQPNPEYGMGMMRTMMEDAKTSLVWADAAKHRHGAGMETGLDLSVTQKHYN